MRQRLVSLVILAAATLPVLAGEPAGGKFDLTQFSFATRHNDSESVISPDPGKEGFLKGAVELRYEQILLLCDQTRFVQNLFPGTKVAILDWGEVTSGPTGPKPDQVIFDSLATSLAKMPLRTRMTPSRMRVDRVPTPEAYAPTPGSLGLATFHAVLSDLYEFAGDSRTKDKDGQDEWKGLSGWAATVEAVLVGDVMPGGLANTRLRELRFHGHPGDADHPRKVAELYRYQRSIGGASGSDLVKEPIAAHATGQEMWVAFNDAGEVVNYGTKGYATGSMAEVFPKHGMVGKKQQTDRAKEVVIGTITSTGSDRLDLMVKKHPHPAIPTDAQTVVTARDGTVLALADLVAGQEVEISLVNGIARSIRIVAKR